MGRTAGIAGLPSVFVSCLVLAGPALQDAADDASPASETLFETRLEVVLPSVKPTGILVGDVDADGRTDLIAATQMPGELRLWNRLSEGLGAFGEPDVTVPVGGYPLAPVWFVGEEHRANPLVAVASQARSLFALLDVDAEVEKERVRSFVELPSTPLAIATGDLGLDGLPEAAVITELHGLLLFGTDGEIARVELADEIPTCVHFMADGEGVVVGFQVSGRVAFFQREGERSLRDSGLSLELGGIPRDFAEIDVDRDGDLELAVAGGNDSVWIFGFGVPSVFDEPARPVTWKVQSIPIDLEVADVDGDGADELFVLNYQSLTISILDDFSADKKPTRRTEEAGQTSWDCAVADLDADGALDVAVANRDAYRISLLQGDGSGEFWRPHDAETGRAPRALATGDLDGDGLPEAIASSSIENDLTVLRNDGGRLVEGHRIAAGTATDAVACADVDGDGHADVGFLAAGPDGAELHLLFGDGSGEIARRHSVGPLGVGSSVGGLALVDLDGDGHVEAAVTDPESGALRLYGRDREAADFRLEEWGAIDLLSGPGDVTAHDLDGDGRRELLVALQGPGERFGAVVVSATGERGARLALVESRFVPAATPILCVRAADFDADGRTDLVLLGAGRTDLAAGALYPWVRREDGDFQPLDKIVTGLHPYRIGAGDLNGDGRTDLLVSCQHSHHVNVWVARPGEPVSFERLPDLGVGRGPLDLVLDDVDGDGRLDVLVANHFSASVSTVLNRTGR